MTTQVTRYEVSCLPEGHVNRRHFAVTVEYHEQRWAVRCWVGEYADRNGSLDWPPRPPERTDEWLDEHRFDLDTALAIAADLAPKLVVNGRTVADILARSAR